MFRWLALATFVALCLAQPEGYASLSGYGNNENNPSLNAVFAPYVRLGERNSYADQLGAIDPSLPNERELSNRLFAFESERPQVLLNDLHIAIGQAISHDIQSVSSTDPELGIEVEGEVYLVDIPTGDPYFDPYGTGDKTMTFKRRNYMADSGSGTNQPRNVKNLVSPLLDLSIVYSNFDTILDELRNKTHPRYMKIGYTALSEPSLPYNTFNVPMENQFRVPTEQLYAAGHSAANQNPMVLAAHHLFLLEHNRLADQLADEHKSWSEEKLFWEARRWNIAQFQAITFNEYIPALTGDPLPVYDRYDEDIDVSPTFLFNAAFRVAHSNLSPSVLFVSESKEILTSVRFRDSYFRPELIDKLGLNNLIRGLIFQTQNSADLAYISDIRNFLFGAPGSGGLDLAALCAFRARDLGIPFYNDAREILGLPRINYYSEVISDATVAAALHDFYGHPDNAEGFVMGLAEDAKVGSGPLFTAAINEQAIRLRAGDRFYYENRDAGFSSDEIEEISRTTIADIILRVTNVQQVPCSAFFKSPDYDCGEPPSIDAEFTLLENQVELLNGDIILSWNILNDVINFAAEVNTKGWFAIGLANNAGNMIGADAMIGWVEGSTPVVGDYKITARAVGCDGVCPDTQQGGSNDITDISGTESGGKSFLQWSRALDTGDSEDEAITDGIIPIVFAMSASNSDSLSYHQSKKGAADINFFTGDLTLTAVDEQKGPNDRLTVHAVLMWFAWSVIFPAGIVAVKFCRKLLPRWWFRLHMLLQYTGVLLIIVSLILAVEAVSDLGSERKHLNNPHAIMGIISVCLAIITPALGQATAVMYEAPKSVPFFPDRAHSLLGYFSPLVAYVTIYLGLDEKNVKWYWYLLVSIWLFFITVTYWSAFIAQYFFQIYQSNKNKKANMGISAEENEESWSSGEE